MHCQNTDWKSIKKDDPKYCSKIKRTEFDSIKSQTMSFRNEKEILVYAEAVINETPSGRPPVCSMQSKKLLLANNVTCQSKISNRREYKTSIQNSEIKILDYNEEK